MFLSFYCFQRKKLCFKCFKCSQVKHFILQLSHFTKTCKTEPPDLYFYYICFFISFYIGRYCFSQIFTSSFNIIPVKKIFVTNFPFQYGFMPLNAPPPPPTSPTNLTTTKSTKHDKSFLSMLPQTYYSLPDDYNILQSSPLCTSQLAATLITRHLNNQETLISKHKSE